MTTEAEAAIWKDVGVWVLDDFRVWIEAMIEARIGRHLAPSSDVRPTDVPIAHRITRADPDRELHIAGRTTSSRTKPSRHHAKCGPHDALYLALKERWIADAGLDDIEEEPAKQRDWKPVNLLFDLDNVVITPHAAYYSEEAIRTVRDLPHMKCHGC